MQNMVKLKRSMQKLEKIKVDLKRPMLPQVLVSQPAKKRWCPSVTRKPTEIQVNQLTKETITISRK
jgi:hypothetical protein